MAQPLTNSYSAVWNADATYQLGMVVVHANAAWAAATDNVRSEPAALNSDWTVVLTGAALALTANAGLAIASNLTSTVFTTQNVWVPITAGWGPAVAPVSMTVTPASGTITAGATGRFLTICTLGFTSAANVNLLQFGVFQNGVLLDDLVAVGWTDTDVFPTTLSITGLTGLTTGDGLDVRGRCLTANGIAITVLRANFSVVQIS